MRLEPATQAALLVDILLCLAIAQATGHMLNGRVLKERDFQQCLQVRPCSHRDGQRLDPAVRRICLRRPQRPGNQNAGMRSQEPSSNPPSRIAGTAGLPRCSSRRSGHLTFHCKHSASTGNWPQQKIDVCLCRSCGGRQVLVEGFGKRGVVLPRQTRGQRVVERPAP
jgi:hypothetical protein